MGETAAETVRKRNVLAKQYDSVSWRKKVNLMPPEQVTAIYLRLAAQGKIKN